VGGTYTLSIENAHRLHQQLQPRWTVPMHYRTAKVALDIAPRDEFVAGLPKESVVNANASEWRCHKGLKDDTARVILLDP
jgi:hypothetical protein